MNKMFLIRTISGDQGTEGFLTNGDFICKTLELPWRNNQRNISCVPTGKYECRVRKSPRFGIKYHVKNVPNRGYILIHAGNFAGDVDMGFRSDTEGCILLGQKHGYLSLQRAVFNSRDTVQSFMSYLAHEDFTLNIIGGY